MSVKNAKRNVAFTIDPSESVRNANREDVMVHANVSQKVEQLNNNC